MTAILFADKYYGELMLGSKCNAFEEIRLGSSTITTVGHSDDRGFPQFAGECDASSMKNLRCNRAGTSDHVVLMVAPVRYCMSPRLPESHLLAWFHTVSSNCLTGVRLQIGAKNFIGCHTDGQHNSQVSIIGQGEVFAYLNTDSTCHLGRLVTTTASNKAHLSLFIQGTRILIHNSRQKHTCIEVA